MTPRVLKKSRFPEFVTGILKQTEVYAPVRLEGQEASHFTKVDSATTICLDYLNPKLPVKELFFPQREVLFRFKPGAHETAEPGPPIPERVVLGVRPCDAAALEMFDRVFLDEPGESDRGDTVAPRFTDPYYEDRRGRTTLVGLACNEPGNACFCTALNGGPHATRGLDLLLVDVGDRYLARPVTAKGEKLVADLPEAPATDVKQADSLDTAARAAIDFTIDAPALLERLQAGFDHDVWDEISLPCINCGVCTYVCPTCYCFDVTDEESATGGVRLRTWDSCQFALFTRHASGHNPRQTGRDRLRQRTLHKFRYYPAVYGEPLCVGCGRCITECPTGIDLRDTLETLRAALDQNPEK